MKLVHQLLDEVAGEGDEEGVADYGQLGEHLHDWEPDTWFAYCGFRSSKYSFWADPTKFNIDDPKKVYSKNLRLIQISNLCSQLSLQQHVSFHRQTSEHQVWSRPSCWEGQRGGREGRRQRRWWWTRTGEPSRGTPGTGPRCPPGSSLGWFASSLRRLFLVQDAEIWRCLEFSLR